MARASSLLKEVLGANFAGSNLSLSMRMKATLGVMMDKLRQLAAFYRHHGLEYSTEKGVLPVVD